MDVQFTAKPVLWRAFSVAGVGVVRTLRPCLAFLSVPCVYYSMDRENMQARNRSISGSGLVLAGRLCYIVGGAVESEGGSSLPEKGGVMYGGNDPRNPSDCCDHRSRQIHKKVTAPTPK